jgi:hypothetical protein
MQASKFAPYIRVEYKKRKAFKGGPTITPLQPYFCEIRAEMRCFVRFVRRCNVKVPPDPI